MDTRPLEFAWDERKGTANRRKHGVSFEEARTAFDDDYALLIDDLDHSDSEDRFILLGLSASRRLLVVCHAYRAADSVIRVFSARRASPMEERVYWGRWS